MHQYYFSPLSPIGTKKSLAKLLEAQDTGNKRAGKMEDENERSNKEHRDCQRREKGEEEEQDHYGGSSLK